MKRIMRNIVNVLVCIIISFSGLKLLSERRLYKEINEFNKEIEKYMPTEKVEELSKLRELIKINSDVKGWIKIKDTNINYPILQGQDNSFYLDHNVFKEEAYNGSIFLDFRCNSDFSSFNNVLYGHNLKSGQMFGEIKKYKDESYFYNHKEGWIYTSEEIYKLQIFAFIITDINSPIYNQVFLNNEDKINYLSYINNNAVYISDNNIDNDDKIVILSTCTDGLDDNRWVIVAKVLDEK